MASSVGIRTGKVPYKPLVAAYLLRRRVRAKYCSLANTTRSLLSSTWYQKLCKILRCLRAVYRRTAKLEARLLHTYKLLIDSNNLHQTTANHPKARGSTSRRGMDEEKLLNVPLVTPRTLPGIRRLLYPYDIYTQTPDRVRAIEEKRGPFFEQWEAGGKYWESTGKTTD